jgi:RNA polymerase sigma-70 factor (ECF subfamily)
MSDIDADLITRTSGGDNSAFGELLGRHEVKLFRLAMGFVHNEDDAQEIVQGVFLSAWRGLSSFEGRSQLGSWLYRVTVNAALMFLRVRERHAEVAVEDLGLGVLDNVAQFSGNGPQRPENPDEQLQSAELRQQIQKSVKKLPDLLRRVFLVRDVEGLSTARAARELGLSEPAVKTRLHRARRALRVEMKDYLAAEVL